MGDTAERLLRRAGQPAARPGRVFRYCVAGAGDGTAKVVAVFTPQISQNTVGLIASTARGASALGAGPGDSVRLLRGRTRSFGAGVLTARSGGARMFFGVRKGRVDFVAAASSAVASSPGKLRAYLKLAGLR